MKKAFVPGGRFTPAAVFLSAALGFATAISSPAAAQAMPDINELPEGPGREEVFYNCYACHSFRIIKQQRLPESTWDELMDWMVEKQAMPPLSPDDRKAIVKYLGKHYGPNVPR
jgi:mono/diheme cytochrome c family protein